MKNKKNLKHLPETFIFGMNITGLNTARSLGRHGISVTGIDYGHSKIGFLSKYCKKLICPHPMKQETLFLDFLIELGRKLRSKAVLIPTNDEFLLSISRNRNKLGRYFIHSFPSEEIIENLNNKEAFYNLSIKYNYPVPKTYFPNEEVTIEKIGEEINYPCIIKMKYGYYYKDIGFKAIKISSKDELIENYHKVIKYLNDVMVQEIVPGKEDQQYSLYSYLNKDSIPLASLASRKLRQLPIEFGVGTLVESCDEPEIKELGLSFLTKVNYQGLSEIEFKKDSRDNQYKIIEVNTRPWMQINLATKSGIDFCYLAYIDLIGQHVDAINNLKKGVKWLCFESDFYACFGASGYIRKGLLTLTDWLSSLKGDKEYASFAPDDLKPFLYKLLGFFKVLAKSIKKGFLSRILRVTTTDLK